jgi:biotin carboxyl carrier protein
MEGTDGKPLMEFKIADLANLLNGEIISTAQNGSVLIRIGGEQHSVRLLKASSAEFEFILDHTYHHAKILSSGSAEVKLAIDGLPVTVRRHSKLTEVLEKASSGSGLGASDRNLASQIPGRVVSINAKAGADVKKGDVMVVLESMKMQVAVKAHKDGKVREIKVKQGSSVARNDIIAVIE